MYSPGLHAYETTGGTEREQGDQVTPSRWRYKGRKSVYVYMATISKRADGGQLDGSWMSMGNRHNGATCHDLCSELVAVSITDSIHISLSHPLPLALNHLLCSVSLAQTYRPDAPHRQYHLRGGTHDVADALNQRWRTFSTGCMYLTTA